MEKYWTTRDGEEILISEMTDIHIIRAIKNIRQKAKDGIHISIDCGYCGDDNFKTYEDAFIEGNDVIQEFMPGYIWLVEEANKRFLDF